MLILEISNFIAMAKSEFTESVLVSLYQDIPYHAVKNKEVQIDQIEHLSKDKIPTG